jgi:hypothetical protein
VQSSREGLLHFEKELSAGTIDVDDMLYERFRAALAAFPPIASEGGNENSTQLFQGWRPTLRHPEDLYSAYSGGGDSLSRSSREAAQLDMRALSPPHGLNRTQFDLWIGMQLRQHPEVIAIDSLLERPRRFGEMRDFILQRGAVDGVRGWQQWMRWLLHFLGADYIMWVANYSEIFARREIQPISDREQVEK